jgi:hypothetical protein
VPAQPVLIMAMTRMLSGVCTAGFTTEPDAVSHLCWVRPVREQGSLLLGDLTDADGRVLQPDDVVELRLERPRPEPPHTEDWVTDFIFHRPCLLRRLEGERRARFLAEHLDLAPQEILGPHPTRSLCLIRPEDVWARFNLDSYSLKYEARVGFTLGGERYPRTRPDRGVPVSDIKWRALGRGWLGDRGGTLKLDKAALLRRLEAEELYLALGLSRSYQGQLWLLVIGVHAVPDYQVPIDYENL